MKNTRNKKLLACFLTALVLSANSLNVSAKLNEVINNTRFVLNLGGNKCGERKRLNQLADDIGDFIKKNCDKKTGLFITNFSESKGDYLNLCERLYNELNWIYLHRACDYDGSILKKNMDKKQKIFGNELSVLEYYDNLKNKDRIEFSKLSLWLKVVSLAVIGGNCSVWGGRITKTVEKLARIGVIE